MSLENGAVYRVAFTTGSSQTSLISLRGFKETTNLETNASSPDFNRAYFGTNNSFVFYVRATATGTRYIGFRATASIHTADITSFSIKKADSNMGLMI